MSDDGRPEGRVIQPSNDVNELLRLAEEGKASFESALQQVSRGMAGVSLEGVRVKSLDQLNEDLARGEAPETIPDFLSGRIYVDSPEQIDEVLDALKARFKVLRIDEVLEPPPSEPPA